MRFSLGFSFSLFAIGPVVLGHPNGTMSGFGFWFGPFYMLWQWKEKACPNS